MRAARLVPERDFDLAPGYLNTASVGVPPREALGALREAVDAWGRGLAQPPEYDEPVQRARETFARLHHVAAGSVAIAPQVSIFTAQVLSAVPPGAEVVAYANDFTSVLFPLLQRTDVHTKLVESLEDIPHAITAGTRLVAVSAVQSADGLLAPLADIAAAAEHHGALTYVDATQACGWLPLHAGDFDFFAATAYKWLLSPRGTSFMAVRENRLDALTPLAPGWYAGEDRWVSLYGPPLRLARDARRFDVSPAWLNWVATASALGYLERVGIESIHAHDLALANRLRAGSGLPPGDSPIVSVPAAGAAEKVERAGLRAAVREGQLRASFHLYNTEADVDLVLEALR